MIGNTGKLVHAAGNQTTAKQAFTRPLISLTTFKQITIRQKTWAITLIPVTKLRTDSQEMKTAE